MEVSLALHEIFLIELFQYSSSTLENVGINAGKAIIEKVLKDKTRVSEPLEMIKVICKDFWGFVYSKQMDNLKTNHRGVFVLSDNNFKGISKFSSPTTAGTLDKQSTYLLFPCGMIKGALENMGINASVSADVMPGNTSVAGKNFQRKKFSRKMKKLFSTLTNNLSKLNVSIPDFRVLVLGNGRDSGLLLSKWLNFSFPNDYKIHEIKYGQDSKLEENVYNLPNQLLKSCTVAHVPRFSEQDPDKLNSMVHNSSWVILVTDSNHLLSRSERNFLNDYSGKPNLDLMVNVLPGTDEIQVKKDLKDWNSENLNVLMMKLGDAVDLKVLNDKCDKLSKSNDSIVEAERFSAIKMLTSKQNELEIAETNLKSISKSLQSLEQRIQTKQDLLYTKFKTFDLVVLEQDLAELVTGLNTFFKNYAFWKLIFKSDYLAQDLQLVLKDYSLMNGELQLAFSMGRLEQGKLDIFDNLKKDLTDIGSRFPDLESDISRIIDLIGAVSKESVDPFLLRDQVVSFVQPVETLELQDQVDSIARTSLGIQMFWGGLAVLLYSLEAATWLIPSSAVAAGLLLGWLRLRWGSCQDLFIAKLGLSHKRLSENVQSKFESEFKSRIHDSVATVLHVTEEAIQAHLQKLSKKQQEVASLLESFKKNH